MNQKDHYLKDDAKRIAKNSKEITKMLPYKLKIMVTARFIIINLVNNLAEEIQPVETCGI